jgi:hypothetical protein
LDSASHQSGSGRQVCPLCRSRRGKRLCPAKGERICAHCCGTKRLVEIDCPSDCVYLAGVHAGAWEGRETERNRDARRIGPYVQGLDEAQVSLLFMALSGINALRGRRRDFDDRLLAQAVSALRKTVETRVSGLLYEHQAEDARAQGLVYDLGALFEAEGESGDEQSPDDGDLLAVLIALDGCLTAALAEREGPTVFLDTVARLVGRFSEPQKPRPLIVEP